MAFMKIFLFLLIAAGFYLPLQAQHLIWLDSINVHPSSLTTNDTVELKVTAQYSNTGVAITRISTTLQANVIHLDIYTTYCAGFDVLIPFDTSVYTGPLQQGNYIVQYQGIIDTNTTDTLNCFYITAPVVFDSAAISFSVLPDGIVYPGSMGRLEVHVASFGDDLNIYVSALQPDSKLEIYDSKGSVVWEKNISDPSNGNEAITVNGNYFTQGIYTLRLQSGFQVQTLKFLKM